MSRIAVLVAVAATLIASPLSAQDRPPAEAEKTASNRGGTEGLYPAEIERWKDSPAEKIQGVRKSNGLRQKLLKQTATGERLAEVICRVVADFQQQLPGKLAGGRPVAAFEMTPERLLAQLRGEIDLNADAFAGFDGRWFGRWDQMNVNHDWRPARRYAAPKKFAADLPAIEAIQYAWISNGFGWNYLASLDGSGGGNCVLGMVYYFEDPDYGTIVGETPLVGFADSPTRLVWITSDSVYLEEVFGPPSRPDTYVITALRHDLLGDEPTVSREAVQATYTRVPEMRPAFRKFAWAPDRDRYRAFFRRPQETR